MTERKIIPGNANGDAELITSYIIQAKGKDGTIHIIGNAVTFSPTERRDMTYNFVIGNNPPDEARDIIPGVVREASITVDYVALYKEGVIKAFGQDSGYDVLISIRNQTKPFDVVVTVTDPSNSSSQVTTYSGCYISDYRATKDMGRGDIRILETVTINFRSVSSSGNSIAAE